MTYARCETMNKLKTVVCGMSGGVDSAVAALTLKQKGYNVVGLFMKNWDSVNEHGICTSDQDREDAQEVCDHLRIPFHEVNFVKEYWNKVFSSFINDLQEGRTPNPDILCNKYIKFNAFHKYAMNDLGADALATGHYARTSLGYDLDNLDDSKGVDLLKAVDGSKCQTLFLSQISQSALQKALFPVGNLQKSQVKQIATENGLEKTAKRKESMGICFIGKRNFHDFIEDYIEPQPGHFIHVETGEIMGQHKGIHLWTLGQRVMLSGLAKGMFVCDKDPQSHDIIVAPGTDHPALFMQTFQTERPHWINKPPPELLTNQMFEGEFKYQHATLSREQKMCTASYCGDDSLLVTLREPERSICPGQYAVFYQGDTCLGSAKIQRIGQTMYEHGKTGVLTGYQL